MICFANFMESRHTRKATKKALHLKPNGIRFNPACHVAHRALRGGDGEY